MTTTYQIIYWRDIPAQIKVKAGHERASRPLPERFERAIDQAAMYAGLIGSDEYLTEWRRSEWLAREGELEAVADALVAELDTAYSQERLRQLARNAGRDEA